MSFVACRQQDTYHLPPDKMERILYDAHLAESYSMVLHQDSLHRNTERNPDSLAAFYKTIFNHYKITEKDFEKSLDWYKHHPEELDVIYTRLLPEFSKLEAKYSQP